MLRCKLISLIISLYKILYLSCWGACCCINACWLNVYSGCKYWVSAPWSKGKICTQQCSRCSNDYIKLVCFFRPQSSVQHLLFLSLLLTWNLGGECCVMPLYFPLRWLSQACFVDTSGVWDRRLHGSSAAHPARTESPHQELTHRRTSLTRK